MNFCKLDSTSINLNQLEQAFKEVEESYDTSKSILNWFGHKYLVIDSKGNVGTTRFGFLATNFDTIVSLIKKSAGDFPKDKSLSLARGLERLRTRYLYQRNESWSLKHIFHGIFPAGSSDQSAETARKIVTLEKLKELGFRWDDPKKIEENFGSLLYPNPSKEFLPAGWKRAVRELNQYGNPSHIEMSNKNGNQMVTVKQGKSEAFINVEIHEPRPLAK